MSIVSEIQAAEADRKVTKLPGMKERLASEGFEIDDSPPEVFQAMLRRDVEKWAKVVKEAKVKAE